MPEPTGGHWQLDIGARPLDGNRVRFRVWAPRAKQVAVKLRADPVRQTSLPAAVQMEPCALGYFEATVSGIAAGSRYSYILDGDKTRPDPASRFQPDGVHDASAVVDPDAFPWTDHTWTGIPHKDLILYELHTGTFTKEGTFEAILPLLDYLRDDLGVTAIELMPVAQFPGKRNWGYDGAYLYAPQSSYGGPEGLKRLVDACHAKGLAVVLDVVYNHLGPEGNYLSDFGPYFSDRYRTPWGSAVNYDGPDSDEVRHYVISNAISWIVEYHIDALRLDAIHGIFDFSAHHILKELNEAVQAEAKRSGRSVSVIAESDLNDVRILAPPEEGGYGLAGQWHDDFHHALHSLVTGEQAGYYADYGRLEHLAAALREGYVLCGKRSIYRRRRHGSSSRDRPASQFVVYAQNHDQIGNRAQGDRLSTIVPEALKVIGATVLLAPNIPLLFMGEEYGETAPFQYFIDHSDPNLVEAVRQGRRADFAHWGWKAEDIPDPYDVVTFERSRVNVGSQTDPQRAAMLRWTRSLISLRKRIPALGAADSGSTTYQVWAYEGEQVLVLHRWARSGPAALILLAFNKAPGSITLREPEGSWTLRLASTTDDLGATAQPTIRPSLTLHSKGTIVQLPAYAALVYVSSAST